MRAALLHPDRHIQLEGTFNLRDLGGYEGAEGRQTRWRCFFRCDGLHRLSPASQDRLLGLGLRTIIDLRATRELEEAPNVFASSSKIAFLHHNMNGDRPLASLPDEGKTPQHIADAYTLILDRRKAQIGETLAALAAPEALPALYHCASGKDRTGRIAALLLGLAGVAPETIAADYGLSARYLAPFYLASGQGLASIRTWEDFQREFCPPEAMLMTLEHLEQHYGGVEGYVLATGLTREEIARLRAAMLE